MRPVLLTRINADIGWDIHRQCAQGTLNLDLSAGFSPADVAAFFACRWFEDTECDFGRQR